MKTISLAEAQSDFTGVLESSQKQRVVITRNGRPCAVLMGVEGYDEEDLRLASAPEFWHMIQERRRKGKSIALAEVEARLRVRARARRTAVRKRASSRPEKAPAVEIE